jgi:L-fuconolactonase
MRIDAHQHFWRYHRDEYPWMSPAMEALRRDFLPGDLGPELEAAGFDGTIAVQARQTLEETRWLLELADGHPFVRGVVGWVDLRSPDVDAQLARFAAHPKLVGVRHVVHDEPDDGFMARPDFRRGIARLRGHGLAYDLLVFPKHLPLAARLAEEFPDQAFVLDHVAKPLVREGRLSPWDEDLRRLAAFPNVSGKLSGLVTEARWGSWKAEDFRPYLDVVLAAFGPERLMIGSDWPVCTLSGAYGATMAIVVDYAGRLAPGERDAVLGGNALRLYGVGRPRGEG